jgi:hypothetical protein
METSESINDLAAALSKAQSQMTGAKKSANNPFFKSKYSDLAEVMEAISEPFADNDLCFVQGAEVKDNLISVKTRIIHASGQWIESDTVLPPTKNDAQGYGSAITYAKRYGLQALAGVPSVDDDGNAAVAHKTKKTPYKPTQSDREQVKIIQTHYSNGDIDGLHDELKGLDGDRKGWVWGQLDTEIHNWIKTALGASK